MAGTESSNSSATLSRFFIQNEVAPLTSGGTVELSAEDSHHAIRVKRLKTNDRCIVVCQQSNQAFEGHLLDEDPEKCSIQIGAPVAEDPRRVATDTLIFALSKGKKNELVCEKATELGISSVIIWQTNRSIVRLKSEKDASEKIERWKKIALSAAKQCQRDCIPEIVVCLSREALAKKMKDRDGVKLLGSLSDSVPAISELPKEQTAESKFHIAIGPEGDFTEDETEFLIELGFQLVSLGPNILRSETAAIASIAMIEALYGSAAKKVR